MKTVSSFLLAFFLAVISTSIGAAAVDQACLQNGNGRIVLIGDSITGLSRNAANGFAYDMEAAIKATYPDSKLELEALGGSGQSVGSWLGVEENSRTKEANLDVKGIGVKATLDQPADVVVIMLGMNDVLAPYIDNTPASLDRWAQRYEKLIDALQRRVKPRLIALGSVTPCTEAPDSPKNQLIDAMNERVRALAQKVGGRYLPTSESVWEILQRGRTLKSDFHVTYDFVHPNEPGHLGIAIGMLKGLGETKAAEWLATQKLPKIWKNAVGAKPSFSWQVMPAASVGSSNRLAFRIKYWWSAAGGAANSSLCVTLTAPSGWQVTPPQINGATGEFMATGAPDQFQNTLTMDGQAGDEKRVASVMIPAPWLVAAKLVQPWSGAEFDPGKGRTAVDDAIEKGGDFTGPIEGVGAQKLVWQIYFSSVNFTGLDNPGSVDFNAVTHPATFEAGYGARWIYSERDRPVRLQIGASMFAGAVHLIVWLNGKDIYCDKLGVKTIDTELKKGWNSMVFKSNHRTWQWQQSIALAGVGDDSLADLRYSVKPPEHKTESK